MEPKTYSQKELEEKIDSLTAMNRELAREICEKDKLIEQLKNEKNS